MLCVNMTVVHCKKHTQRRERRSMSAVSANPFHGRKLLLHPPQVAILVDGKMTYPQTIEVDLADGGCNQSCDHCCFGSGQAQKMVFIDPDALIRALTEAYALGTRAVELVGGGEPTTHPQLREIIERILAIGDGSMRVGLITNGVLAERVLSVAPRMEFIRVSLDTADPELYRTMHGAPDRHFPKVLKNIRRLREVMTDGPGARRLGVGYLVVPPSNHTIEQIEAGARLACQLEVDYITYRPVELDRTVPQEQWREAQRGIRSARSILEGMGNSTAVFGGSGMRWDVLKPGGHPVGMCTAKPLVAVIKASGAVAFCILHRNATDMDIGNIRTQSFTDLWFGDSHVAAWQGHDVISCPTPCKFDGYNKIVQDAAAGVVQIAPSRNEVAHHDFV
jgi:MoaA/NifB/PqqE/SkfB family radical SAM enzyme